MPRKALPEYASCPRCGEYREAALRAGGLCANCANVDPRKGIGYCATCNRDGLPLQEHHIAGRRYSDDTVAVCLNCHSVLSQWQRQYPTDNALQAEMFGCAALLVLLLEPGFDEEGD